MSGQPTSPSGQPQAWTQGVVRAHTGAYVQGILARAKTLGDLAHKGVKGRLRESLFAEMIRPFLPHNFGLSSGVIVNAKGEKHRESNESDVIIYDRRLPPPFVDSGNQGLVPADSVLAVIEVKSELDATQFGKAATAARRTAKEVCAKVLPEPLMALFAFAEDGPADIRQDCQEAKDWLTHNAGSLGLIAVAGKYSWINKQSEGWVFGTADPKTCEEVKRFVGVLLDNCVFRAEARSFVRAVRMCELLGIWRSPGGLSDKVRKSIKGELLDLWGPYIRG